MYHNEHNNVGRQRPGPIIIMKTMRSLIKRILPSPTRVRIRRWYRHVKNSFRSDPKTTIDELRDVLVHDFAISQGDKLIVSSSFGQLNAEYSPQDVVDLLKELVGGEGLIMMPYYPPMNSTEWAAKGEVFDMTHTRSGMGILTNVFAHSEGVVMSKHPTKAVCVWGKDAAHIASGHDSSITPFFWDSPYGKLLKLHSKSLGLGLKNIPIFHTFEDVLAESPDYYYQANKYALPLITCDGERVVINTFVHDDNVLNKCVAAGDYVRSLKCKSYIRCNFGHAFLYVIDNDDLFDRCRVEFAHGNSRIRN